MEFFVFVGWGGTGHQQHETEMFRTHLHRPPPKIFFSIIWMSRVGIHTYILTLNKISFKEVGNISPRSGLRTGVGGCDEARYITEIKN